MRDVKEEIAQVCLNIENRAANADARCNFAVLVCRGSPRLAILRLWREESYVRCMASALNRS